MPYNILPTKNSHSVHLSNSCSAWGCSYNVVVVLICMHHKLSTVIKYFMKKVYVWWERNLKFVIRAPAGNIAVIYSLFAAHLYIYTTPRSHFGALLYLYNVYIRFTTISDINIHHCHWFGTVSQYVAICGPTLNLKFNPRTNKSKSGMSPIRLAVKERKLELDCYFLWCSNCGNIWPQPGSPKLNYREK